MADSNPTTSDQRRRLNAMLMANQFDRPTYYDQAPVERAGLLPLGTYPNGETGLAFPGFITEPIESWNRMVQAANAGEKPSPEDAFNVAGAAMVGGFAAPKPVNALGSAGGRLAEAPGIRAYHGSPHDFDKFDLSKIGTGEGAQAYGHGLYFAEREGVARSYRDALGGQKLKDGTPFDDLNPAHWAADAVNRAGGDRAKAVQLIAADMTPDMKIYEGGQYHRLLRAKGMLERNEAVPEIGSGRMYEVNIKANPEDFLDWDKPLSQQSEKMRNVITDIFASKANVQGNPEDAYRQAIADWNAGPKTTPLTDDPNVVRAWDAVQMAKKGTAVFDGERVRNILNDAGRGSPEEWRQTLLDAGIPGIRYLDQGSRDAGDGTYNYVVFDDSLIDILRKYGLAGLTAGGAATNLLGQYSNQPSPQPHWSNRMMEGDL